MNDYEKVEKMAAELSTLLGITLVKQFDDEMNNPENYDKDNTTKGIFYTVVDPKHTLSTEMNYPLDIGIFVNETFQFYQDATPLTTSLNTEEEKRLASQTLMDCSTPIKDLTPELYESFIHENLEQIMQGE